MNSKYILSRMKMQIRAQSYKSHPKALNPSRNSETSQQEGMVPLNERPLLNSIRQINVNASGTISSAKVRLQRPQEYLIRKQLSIKEYEGEIEKLSQICEQFFKENQNLKQCLREQQQKSEQIWNRRVSTLENELRKHREILDHKNSIIQGMNNASRKSISIQNNNSHPDHSRPRLSFTGNPQNANIIVDGSKVEKLMKQLERRESELMKYMHKQAQFIQIYVEKQRLEQQIRSLESVVAAQAKQLEDTKKNHLKRQQKCQNQPIKADQSLELQRIKIYNQKLLEMLRVGSNQIERLNHILKVKLQESEKNRIIIQDQLKQITYLKQKQSQLQRKGKNEEEAKIKNWEDQVNELEKQNSQLNKRLQDQVGLGEKLRKVVEDLEKEVKENKNKKMSDCYAQTESLQDASVQQIVEGNQSKMKTNETQDQLIENQMNEWSLHQLVVSEKERMQQMIEAYQQRVQCLQGENGELTKFIIQQNTQSLNLKDEIKKLSERNRVIERHLQKLKLSEQKLPTLLSRVNFAEEKLVLVTNQYEKLLSEVQSSYSETQSVHRQIEQALEQKLQILSQYEQTKTQSEVNDNSRVKMNKLAASSSDRFEDSMDIRFDKQLKSQSQAQLHNKE